MGELSGQSYPRCPDCGAWLSPIGDHDHTCANARCGSSWQAAQRDFEGSMLGAAIRGESACECYTARAAVGHG